MICQRLTGGALRPQLNVIEVSARSPRIVMPRSRNAETQDATSVAVAVPQFIND